MSKMSKTFKNLTKLKYANANFLNKLYGRKKQKSFKSLTTKSQKLSAQVSNPKKRLAFKYNVNCDTNRTILAGLELKYDTKAEPEIIVRHHSRSSRKNPSIEIHIQNAGNMDWLCLTAPLDLSQLKSSGTALIRLDARTSPRTEWRLVIRFVQGDTHKDFDIRHGVFNTQSSSIIEPYICEKILQELKNVTHVEFILFLPVLENRIFIEKLITLPN